jgi:hypothetical protein
MPSTALVVSRSPTSMSVLAATKRNSSSPCLRLAVGHAALAGAGVEDGNRLVAVGQQRDFGYQRMDPRDLAQHAVAVHDRRAGLDAVRLAPVDQQLAVVGVGGVIQHLGALRLDGQPFAHAEQGAQSAVLLAQVLDLGGALRLARQFAARGCGLLLGRLQAAEIAAASLQRAHRRQRQHLQRRQRGRDRRSHRRAQAQPGVEHHQQHRQRAEQQQLGQRRQALAVQ